MITEKRVQELIREHDEAPIEGIGRLNYYKTYMQILFENEGISSWDIWDYTYSKEEREGVFQRTDRIIKKVLG